MSGSIGACWRSVADLVPITESPIHHMRRRIFHRTFLSKRSPRSRPKKGPCCLDNKTRAPRYLVLDQHCVPGVDPASQRKSTQNR
jgi:hypothetical protein